eukprot:TRINITY_DN9482_c0_g1_i6.p1 TRINITY_DN9482_c0_g1~~TRINITY_DN9482_c0_g1_i6.p1  ORF type:complete len:372 (-),score=108.42 TRINITY_DN9482_c0_g1_i6:14-1129(-)
MNSMKVVNFLLVVGLSQSAPQINQQRVVGQVIGQLQPAIQRMVASTLGASRQTSGFGSGSVGTTGFSQGNGFGQAATGFSQGSSFNQGSSASSGLSASQLTSSVVTSLQPAIASAVAEALRSTQSRPSTSVSALSPEEEERINAQQSANAQYNYEYKVGDDDKQTYISHKEARNGENVEGSYNYIDATGALVTVDYQAGPMGYTETREVQEGAVQIDQRNIPQPWSGPLAGVSSTSSASSGSSASLSSSLSQSELIAQILRAIQPQISSAVQSAVGSRNRASTSSFNAGGSSSNLQTASRRGFNSEANLISSVIGALQPQISGAVQSAISRSRPAQVRGPVALRPAPSSGVNDVFGGSGVRIQTPEFNIQY